VLSSQRSIERQEAQRAGDDGTTEAEAGTAAEAEAEAEAGTAAVAETETAAEAFS
jgi:hypothetical protein